MPDYFIPMDTIWNSRYYIKLRNNDVIREYALNYFQKNEKILKKMDFDKFLKDFEMDDKMIKDFVALGEKLGVEYDAEGFERSEQVIKTIVKASIARNAWGRESYYPIINDINEIFQEALNLFDEAETLAIK